MGCSEVFEPNLSEEKILIFSPSEGEIISNSEVQFNWSEVQDAINYHLQVAKPDFIGPHIIILDTLLTKTQFIDFLSEGEHTMRVRANQINNSSEYSFQSFSVNTTTSLQNIRPYIVYPNNNDTSKHASRIVNWYPVQSCEYYLLKTYENNSGSILRVDTLVAAINSDSLTLPTEGSFLVELTAHRDNLTSLPSNRILVLDNSAPIPSSLSIANSNDTLLTETINIQIVKDQNEISTVSDSIAINYLSSMISDTIVVQNRQSIQYRLKGEGEIKITIKSTDKAGNSSSWSLPNYYFYEK